LTFFSFLPPSFIFLCQKSFIFAQFYFWVTIHPYSRLAFFSFSKNDWSKQISFFIQGSFVNNGSLNKKSNCIKIFLHMQKKGHTKTIFIWYLYIYTFFSLIQNRCRFQLRTHVTQSCNTNNVFLVFVVLAWISLFVQNFWCCHLPYFHSRYLTSFMDCWLLYLKKVLPKKNSMKIFER
jgi:hypothetical protein